MYPSFKNQSDARLSVLLTAEEAYPVLERACLEAKTEIWAGFRVFDPRTRLRSEQARRIGETWFDLILHSLKRGVRINLVMADFDPLGAPKLHRGTWRAMRMLITAAELAGAGERLRLVAGLHPARTGLLPRLLFWPLILKRQLATAQRLNRLPRNKRRAALQEMPGLRALLIRKPNERLRP
ncbi:MAG: hypothetical protein KDK89_21210, partial [Alphaproteobacteria bacterium]|nr:hypothetical protein [Alphaproteobacteria bacterium]